MMMTMEVGSLSYKRNRVATRLYSIFQDLEKIQRSIEKEGVKINSIGMCPFPGIGCDQCSFLGMNGAEWCILSFVLKHSGDYLNQYMEAMEAGLVEPDSTDVEKEEGDTRLIEL